MTSHMVASLDQPIRQLDTHTHQSHHPDKIILVANTAWYLFNFRHNLIRHLTAEGFEVLVLSPRDEYVERLTSTGARWKSWTATRSGMRPFHETAAVRELREIYRLERPEIVHHFTLKPILYGTVAASLAKVPLIVNSVTGLGHVFTSNRPTIRALRPLVARWLHMALTRRNVRTIFQSLDDLRVIGDVSPRVADLALMTYGSGVDTVRFAPGEATSADGPPTILFVGRLLREKGIHEFVEAARICKERGHNAHFIVCGEVDAGNPSAIDLPTLEAWRREGLVDFRGHVERIENLMRNATVCVLPSYREGTPRALLEAAAMGKPLIATDVSGCRDVVMDGVNGLLVRPGCSRDLANAIMALTGHREIQSGMSVASRTLAETKFNESRVVDTMLCAYRDRGWLKEAHGKRDSLRLRRGILTVSLDFELAWGTRGRPSASEVPPFLNGTRSAIHGLLTLFARYQISATWAVVGGLLLGTNSERRHDLLSSANFDDIPAGNGATALHWYAEDVLEEILASPVAQELGCHTLTHLLVDRKPSGRLALERELDRFLEIFAELNLDRPTSFIFPKGQMGHLGLLAQKGFTAVRGPESKWFEHLPGLHTRAGLRLVDALMASTPVVGLPTHVISGLWMIPSSQFYSPFMGVGQRVSVKQRVAKALRGLRSAAEQQRVFHIWAHPFNLGVRTGELLAGLEEIFREAARLRDEGRLEILPMKGIAAIAESQTSEGCTTIGKLPPERVVSTVF